MNRNSVGYDWPLILAYHSISEYRQDALAVQAADFEAQMAWLHRRSYRSITLADFMSGAFKRSERIVIITFDDGYMDNYTLAFPILKQYGYVGTIFLVTDYVNTDSLFKWDLQKITPQRDATLFRVLTWDQVYEMANYGIEFGSHSCTHPELTTLPPQQYEEEIFRSRRELRAKLEREVVSFCYPRANLNTEIIRAVDKAGYSCAVVTPNQAGIPPGDFTLPRVGIYHNITPWLFQLKVTPFIRRIYERIRWPSWKG